MSQQIKSRRNANTLNSKNLAGSLDKHTLYRESQSSIFGDNVRKKSQGKLYGINQNLQLPDPGAWSTKLANPKQAYQTGGKVIGNQSIPNLSVGSKVNSSQSHKQNNILQKSLQHGGLPYQVDATELKIMPKGQNAGREDAKQIDNPYNTNEDQTYMASTLMTMKFKGLSTGQPFPSIPSLNDTNNSVQDSYLSRKLPNRKIFQQYQKMNQANLKEQLRANTSMSQQDASNKEIIENKKDQKSKDEFTKHIVGGKFNKTKVDKFFSNRSPSQQMQYTHYQSQMVDQSHSISIERIKNSKMSKNSTFRRQKKNKSAWENHKETFYRKGEMMQLLDLSKPNQFLSRQPDNIQNYYQQKNQLLTNKINNYQKINNTHGDLDEHQDSLCKSVTGILRYTGLNDQTGQFNSTIWKDGEPPVIIEGSINQSARDSLGMATFRNQNGHPTNYNASIKQNSKISIASTLPKGINSTSKDMRTIQAKNYKTTPQKQSQNFYMMNQTMTIQQGKNYAYQGLPIKKNIGKDKHDLIPVNRRRSKKASPKKKENFSFDQKREMINTNSYDQFNSSAQFKNAKRGQTQPDGRFGSGSLDKSHISLQEASIHNIRNIQGFAPILRKGSLQKEIHLGGDYGYDSDDSYEIIRAQTRDNQNKNSQQIFQRNTGYTDYHQSGIDHEYNGLNLNHQRQNNSIDGKIYDNEDKSQMLKTASVFLQTLKDKGNSAQMRSIDVDSKRNTSNSPNRGIHASLMSAPPMENNDDILINKMSNAVKFTNDSMHSVLHTLYTTEQQKFNSIKDEDDPADQSEKIDIDNVDPRVLLHQNHKSLKNLNHSVMKLMAVQQESISIPKLVASQFLLIDRVPTFLEIDAAQMPFPCKILMRPHQKKCGYSSAIMNLVSNNMAIYCSTRTKNPSARNHQFAILPPVKPVFQFAPLTDKEGVRDIFMNKVYIGVFYDLSSNQTPDSKDDDNDDDKKDNTEEELSHISMIMHVSFPKDKEELKRKKLEAMMKKIASGESNAVVRQEVKLESGKEGMKKIKEITQELSNYYQMNKPQRKGSPSHQQDFVRLNQQQMSMYNNSRNDILPQLTKGNSQDQANQSVKNLNQVETIQQSTNRSGALMSNSQLQHYAPSISDQQRQHLQFQMFDQQNASIDSSHRGVSQPHHYFNSMPRNIVVQQNILDNSILLNNSRYSYTLKKSEMIEQQKRIKNLQWLSKWDQFRKEKSIYVERCLEILKQKRRVINIITIMALIEKLVQMRDNCDKRKQYMRAQFASMMVAIKFKVRYQRVFQKKYGTNMKHRQKQDIRRVFTMIGLFEPTESIKCKQQIKDFLEATKSRKELQDDISMLCQNVIAAQHLVRQIKFERPLKLNYAVMRFQQNQSHLEMFYLKNVKKIKHAAKVFRRLQDYDIEDIPTIINTEKVLDDYMHLQGIRYIQKLIDAQLKQWEIYLKHAKNEPVALDYCKTKIIEATNAMQNITEEIIHYESDLLEDGEGKAVEKMMEDKPWISDDEEEKEEQNDEEQKTESPKKNARSGNKAVSSKNIKTQSSISPEKTLESQSIDHDEIPEDLKSKFHNDMIKKLGKLTVRNYDRQLKSKKLSEISQIRAENDETRQRPKVPDYLEGLGNASVLIPNDHLYDFFWDLKDEIIKDGCDKIPRKFLHYPRIEMFRLIFKLTSMEVEFLSKSHINAYLTAKKRKEEKK